jgi:hypothetical protein
MEGPHPVPDETILLAVYKENADQARQHELFRQTITTLVAGITGAVIGLLSLKETAAVLQSPLLPVAGSFLAVIGTFGLIASMKHYERNRMHVERLRRARAQLDQLTSTKKLLATIKDDADKDHNPRYPFLSKKRLNTVWNLFHLLIIAFGITLCTLAYIHRNDLPLPCPSTTTTH